jgi:hypothetical protein
MIYCKAKLNSSGDKSMYFLQTILNKKHFRELFAYLELTILFTSKVFISAHSECTYLKHQRLLSLIHK